MVTELPNAEDLNFRVILGILGAVITLRPLTRILIPVCLAVLLASCGRKSESFEALKSQGQRAFLNAKYADARRYFIKALTIKPSDRDLLYYTGLSYKRDYIYDSALSYLRRADLLYPGNREVNLEIYEAAVAAKSWTYAAGAIDVLVATGDPPDRYLDILAQIYTELDEPLNIAYYLRKLVAAKPDNPAYYVRLINALLAADSIDAASIVSDSAMSRFGRSNELVACQANIDAYKGNFAQAEKVLRSLLTTDTTQDNIYAYKLNLANILSTQKDKTKKREAIALYKEIRGQMKEQAKVDSLITELEKSL